MTLERPLAVGLTPLETRRDVVLHVAAQAEQMGYTALFVAEDWGHDVSVLLSEIALRTDRIRLGTGVLNVWGRTPATIAMLATSLSDLSGGRFTLGLGAGSAQLAEGLHDVRFQAPVARLETVTRQVRRLLDGERIAPSHPEGSRPLRLAVRAAAPIPIHLAALGARSVRLCGEVAEGWYLFLLPASGLAERPRRRSPRSRGVPRLELSPAR
jgi:alkanesulfonate monooxygenase SsuD/methylene tetrahydromethanopterin reductase-like flavin-dependent oxidoreductase (luciferase family)